MLNNPLGTYAENGNLIDRRNTNFDVELHYPSVNWSAAAASATTDDERRFEVICDGRSRMLYASSIGAYLDGFGFFRWRRRPTAGEEPEQVEGALEGGARVCGDEAEVRICEATLSRTAEECHPTVRGVRAGESVLGSFQEFFPGWSAGIHGAKYTPA